MRCWKMVGLAEREKELKLEMDRESNRHSPASFVLPLQSVAAEVRVVPSSLIKSLKND